MRGAPVSWGPSVGSDVPLVGAASSRVRLHGARLHRALLPAVLLSPPSCWPGDAERDRTLPGPRRIPPLLPARRPSPLTLPSPAPTCRRGPRPCIFSSGRRESFASFPALRRSRARGPTSKRHARSRMLPARTWWPSSRHSGRLPVESRPASCWTATGSSSSGWPSPNRRPNADASRPFPRAISKPRGTSPSGISGWKGTRCAFARPTTSTARSFTT